MKSAQIGDMLGLLAEAFHDPKPAAFWKVYAQIYRRTWYRAMVRGPLKAKAERCSR